MVLFLLPLQCLAPYLYTGSPFTAADEAELSSQERREGLKCAGDEGGSKNLLKW